MGTGWIIAIVLVAVLAVVLVCGGILAALLLPAVQAAREAARRMTLQQQPEADRAGDAQLRSSIQVLPAGLHRRQERQADAQLAGLDTAVPGARQALYKQYRFNEPWNSPHNKALASQMPGVYRCPATRRPSGSNTSYAMLVGPHAISDGPTGRTLRDIKDGTSNTIMVAEAADADINWMV